MRIAVAQNDAGLEGAEARLGWLEAVLDEAGAVELVLLPELFASGYHIGGDVSLRAETADGPTFERIAALGRRYEVAIAYGYAERRGEAIFNAAQCVGPDGAVLGHHRKLAIPPGSETGRFAAGEGVQLFEIGGIRAAMLICYDFEFPETVRAVAEAGAELVLVPTALSAEWRVVADAVTRARAFENGVFLAYANAAGEERGMLHHGGSCIVSPFGEMLAQAGQAAQVIVADMDRAQVATAQARLPYLRDRRQLRV